MQFNSEADFIRRNLSYTHINLTPIIINNIYTVNKMSSVSSEIQDRIPSNIIYRNLVKNRCLRILHRSAECPERSSWNCWYASIWRRRFYGSSCRRITWNAQRVSATRSAAKASGPSRTVRITWRSIRRSVECTCASPWETCSPWRARCYISTT